MVVVRPLEDPHRAAGMGLSWKSHGVQSGLRVVGTAVPAATRCRHSSVARSGLTVTLASTGSKPGWVVAVGLLAAAAEELVLVGEPEGGVAYLVQGEYDATEHAQAFEDCSEQ